jgi:hypothetical protein
MDRGESYRVLSDELRFLCDQGYTALLAQIGRTSQKHVTIGQELVIIETSVIWDDAHEQAIRINAAALGPSTWKLDRLDESIVILPPKS